MQKKIIGFFLILAGILLLFVQTKIAEIKDFITWPFLGLLLSVILLFIFLINQQAQLVLIAGISTAIFLTVWGNKYVSDWPTHWGILIFMFGIAVILQFVVTKHHMTLIIGIFIMLIGAFAWPGLRDIPGLSSIAIILNTYWPALVLVLGFLFLVKK
ncbi:hypothetical protein [Thermoflavimicrobium daqui]|jgi:hypothetical protein|uniref:DUF5668 domain-containing protein n=1 Tax=Thermoflavimicrobium daqui TaxID=2137476 RepID=A0A364K8Q9_9BACL|nr:hypothetical protein [Thermoflavimicrobium daqui]RAL26686.1 hypothetical protein DL897_01145 [Thermoflavimicrobium daqui]